MMNVKWIGGVLLAVTAVLAIPGCYYDVAEELYPPSNCDTTNVTYNVTIKPIIESHCATPGCHVSGGTAPGDFSTYSGLQSSVQNGSFKTTVLVDKNMPPTGSLINCDLNKITAWLNNGGLND